MKSRLNGLDYLRVLAAFSVVWIHGADTNIIASKLNLFNQFAVPSFILMSVYLLILKLNETNLSFKEHFEKVFKRLAFPYFFWTIIYILARWVKAIVLAKSFSISLYEFFLGGSSYHLWFLPAIFFWQLIVYYLHKINFSASVKVLVYFVLSFFGFYFGHYIYDLGILKVGFEGLFIYHIGYIFSALLIFYLRKYIEDYGWLCLLLAIVMFILYLMSKLYILILLFNLLVFMFFLFSRFKSSLIINTLSYYSFGIYLIHALFIEGIQLFALLNGWSVDTFIVTFFTILNSFILSAIMVFLFTKTKFLKWTVV